jgi:hypothetical protein
MHNQSVEKAERSLTAISKCNNRNERMLQSAYVYDDVRFVRHSSPAKNAITRAA